MFSQIEILVRILDSFREVVGYERVREAGEKGLKEVGARDERELCDFTFREL